MNYLEQLSVKPRVDLRQEFTVIPAVETDAPIGAATIIEDKSIVIDKRDVSFDRAKLEEQLKQHKLSKVGIKRTIAATVAGPELKPGPIIIKPIKKKKKAVVLLGDEEGEFKEEVVLPTVPPLASSIPKPLRMLEGSVNGLLYVEEWVVMYITQHKLQLSNDVKNLHISKESSALVAGQITQPPFNTWKVMHTAGAGTCLIHAFLTSLSPTYRNNLSYSEKDKVGKAFRVEDFAKYFQTKPEQFKLLNTVSKFLTDAEIQAFADYYQINIMVTTIEDAQNPKYKQNNIRAFHCLNEDTNGLDYILVFSDGNQHFESMCTERDQYVIPYLEGHLLFQSLASSGLTRDSDIVCDFQDGDKILYKQKQYVVVERKLEHISHDTKVCNKLLVAPVKYIISININDEKIVEKPKQNFIVIGGKIVYTKADAPEEYFIVSNLDQTNMISIVLTSKAKKIKSDEATKVVQLNLTPIKIGEEIADALEPLPIVPLSKKPRFLPKVQKGVALLGPESWVNIGAEPITKRMPRLPTDTVVKVPSYYMDNREMFNTFINRMFLTAYGAELKDDTKGISCDNIGSDSTAFSLLTHQKIIKDYLNLYTPYRGLLLYHGLGSGKT